MDAILSWFKSVEKVQFMAIDGRALTFKSKKAFKVGSRPTIAIAIPIPSGGAQDFKLPVTITKVRQVGPNAMVCTGMVPGAAKNVEQLRLVLNGLDPNATQETEVVDEDSMRRAPRYNWSIRVLSKDLPGFRAVSLDFNRLGVKLSTEGHVEENSHISMMLEVETTKNRELLCQGVVRWSHELGRRKYEVGVEFTDLAPEVAAELENFESFLAERQAEDIAKKSIDGFFEVESFGPGVDGMTPTSDSDEDVKEEEVESEPGPT